VPKAATTASEDGAKKSSSGGGGGLFAGVLVLNAAALGFLAYQCEFDEKLAEQVDTFPVMKDVVGSIRDVYRSTGITTPPIKKSLSPPSPAAAITPSPATKKMSDEQVKKDVADFDDMLTETSKPAAAAAKAPAAVVVKPHVDEKPAVVVAAESAPPVIAAAPAAATPSAPSSSSSHQQQQQQQQQKQQAPQQQQQQQHVSEAKKEIGTFPAVPSETRAKQAKAEVMEDALDELAVQSAALRRELEMTLLRDLNQLDAAALRTRVTQLAAEFFERTKWEGVRLHQSMRQVEHDVTRRYIDLMAQQRAELELEANKMLISREQDLLLVAHAKAQEHLVKQEEVMNNALRSQAEGFHSTLTQKLIEQEKEVHARFQDELNHQVATLKAEHSKQLLDTQARIERLEGELIAFYKIADANSERKDTSINLHRHSAAILALEDALASSRPIGKELNAVKASCAEDPLVLAAIATIPEEVTQKGAKTLPELRAQFAVMRSEMRKVALAPEGVPAVVSQAIGKALASVFWAPAGPVEGDGLEEILSRANYALDQGRLSDVLKELEGVQGYGRVLMKDWTQLANQRLLADQAAKTLRAEAIIKHTSLASSSD